MESSLDWDIRSSLQRAASAIHNLPVMTLARGRLPLIYVFLKTVPRPRLLRDSIFERFSSLQERANHGILVAIRWVSFTFYGHWPTTICIKYRGVAIQCYTVVLYWCYTTAAGTQHRHYASDTTIYPNGTTTDEASHPIPPETFVIWGRYHYESSARRIWNLYCGVN